MNQHPTSGATTASSTELGEYVGSKFDVDGTARAFAGNTIISFVPPGSDEADILKQTAELIQDAIVPSFTLLPPPSWHMTVFELLCDQVRDSAHWSRFLPCGAALEATDEFLATAVQTVAKPERFNMRHRCISATTGGLGLLLDPADDSTSDALHAHRERLSEVTGIRFPDHETYQFHITLAYEITKPSPTTQRTISSALAYAERALTGKSFALPKPVFTYFSDMMAFNTDSQRPAASANAQ